MADPGPADLTDSRLLHRLVVAAVPIGLFVALAVTAALLAVTLRAQSSRDQHRADVLAAARQMGVYLTSIDYRTATRDLHRIVDGTTGSARRQFGAQLRSFPAVLRQERSVSRGTVLAAGLASLHGARASASVAVDATVTSRSSAGTVKHYRMLLGFSRIGGRWLVSTVNFLGLPS